MTSVQVHFRDLLPKKVSFYLSFPIFIYKSRLQSGQGSGCGPAQIWVEWRQVSSTERESEAGSPPIGGRHSRAPASYWSSRDAAGDWWWYGHCLVGILTNGVTATRRNNLFTQPHALVSMVMIKCCTIWTVEGFGATSTNIFFGSPPPPKYMTYNIYFLCQLDHI